MLPSQRENLAKSLAFIEQAQHSDLVLFPEIQLTPFFPQFRRHELLAKMGLNPQCLSISSDDAAIQAIKTACRTHQIMASPNFYVSMADAMYDQSLLIGKQGDILGTAEMVHVLQAQLFYEQDYYTPSKKGFQVFATPFGKIGIVICFDRHLPESIRECALQGAALVLVPTANTTAEPLELFE
jgi:predicted amidohydrolase